MSSTPGGGLPPGLDEETLRRLAEELQRVPVQALLQETIQTIGMLAEGRIAGPHKDLEQARLAIDALRALAPVLAPTLDEATARRLNGSISNMQMAYVAALADVPAAPSPAPAAATPAPPVPAAPATAPATPAPATPPEPDATADAGS